MSNSPFYKTGKSKSPLFQKMSVKEIEDQEQSMSMPNDAEQPQGKMMATLENLSRSRVPVKTLKTSISPSKNQPTGVTQLQEDQLFGLPNPVSKKDISAPTPSDKASPSNSLSEAKNNLNSARQGFKTAKKEKRQNKRAGRKNLKAQKIIEKTNSL
jgi:hypothetical protein